MFNEKHKQKKADRLPTPKAKKQTPRRRGRKPKTNSSNVPSSSSPPSSSHSHQRTSNGIRKSKLRKGPGLDVYEVMCATNLQRVLPDDMEKEKLTETSLEMINQAVILQCENKNTLLNQDERTELVPSVRYFLTQGNNVHMGTTCDNIQQSKINNEPTEALQQLHTQLIDDGLKNRFGNMGDYIQQNISLRTKGCIYKLNVNRVLNEVFNLKKTIVLNDLKEMGAQVSPQEEEFLLNQDNHSNNNNNNNAQHSSHHSTSSRNYMSTTEKKDSKKRGGRRRAGPDIMDSDAKTPSVEDQQQQQAVNHNTPRTTGRTRTATRRAEAIALAKASSNHYKEDSEEENNTIYRPRKRIRKSANVKNVKNKSQEESVGQPEEEAGDKHDQDDEIESHPSESQQSQETNTDEENNHQQEGMHEDDDDHDDSKKKILDFDDDASLEGDVESNHSQIGDEDSALLMEITKGDGARFEMDHQPPSLSEAELLAAVARGYNTRSSERKLMTQLKQLDGENSGTDSSSQTNHRHKRIKRNTSKSNNNDSTPSSD
ncbi:hypothetical protein AKO1_010923 [Acrasis kona]|uniref:Uncharacterized protein n=1 Tax=Acrasis kona TaxID=1008807 RepID=A0AAW2YV06_9EUKA